MLRDHGIIVGIVDEQMDNSHEFFYLGLSNTSRCIQTTMARSFSQIVPTKQQIDIKFCVYTALRIFRLTGRGARLELCVKIVAAFKY